MKDWSDWNERMVEDEDSDFYSVYEMEVNAVEEDGFDEWMDYGRQAFGRGKRGV